MRRFSAPVSSSSTAAYWPVRLIAPRTRSGSRTRSKPATRALPPSGRQQRRRAASPSSSCRRRWGPAARRRCRARPRRSSPRRTGVEPYAFGQALRLDCVGHTQSIWHILDYDASADGRRADPFAPPPLGGPRRRRRAEPGAAADRRCRCWRSSTAGIDARRRGRPRRRLDENGRAAARRHPDGALPPRRRQGRAADADEDVALAGPPPALDLADGGWRGALGALDARRWSPKLLERPWAIALPITGPPATPNSLAWLDYALQAMARAAAERDREGGHRAAAQRRRLLGGARQHRDRRRRGRGRPHGRARR